MLDQQKKTQQFLEEMRHRKEQQASGFEDERKSYLQRITRLKKEVEALESNQQAASISFADERRALKMELQRRRQQMSAQTERNVGLLEKIQIVIRQLTVENAQLQDECST